MKKQRPIGPEQQGRLWARQGLTAYEIEEALRRQAYLCMICRRGNRGMSWQVDHDHEVARTHPHPDDKGCRKCFRGMLCQTCNTALGAFMEDPEVLRRAADYVELARKRA